MSKDALALIAILLLLKKRSTVNPAMLHSLNTLQLESLMDHFHAAIHAMEKINNLSQSGLLTSLPDMKKMLEVVENLPL